MLTVKIRYSHPGTPATVTPLENNRARDLACMSRSAR